MGNLESTMRSKPAVRASRSTAACRSSKDSKANVDLMQAVMGNDDVLIEIMSKLGRSELLKCRKVSQRFCTSSTAVLRRDQILSISQDSPLDHFLTWKKLQSLQLDRKRQAFCRGSTEWMREFPYKNVSLSVFVPYNDPLYMSSQGLRVVELTVLGTDEMLSPAELHRELRKFPLIRKLSIAGGRFAQEENNEKLTPLAYINDLSIEVTYMLGEHLIGLSLFASCLTGVSVFNVSNKSGIPNEGIVILKSLETQNFKSLSFSHHMKWGDEMSTLFAGLNFSKMAAFTWKPWSFNNTRKEREGFQKLIIRIAPNLKYLRIGDGQESNSPLEIPICAYSSLREIVVPVLKLPMQGALSTVSSLKSIRCGKLLISENNNAIFEHVRRLAFEFIHEYEANMLTEQQCRRQAHLVKEAFTAASFTLCTSRNREELCLFIAGFSDSKAMVYDPFSPVDARIMIMGDTQNYFQRKELKTKVSLTWMTGLEELSIGKRVEWSNTSFKMLPWLNNLRCLKLYWPYGECSVKCFARNVRHIKKILICNCHEPRVNRDIEDFMLLRKLLPQVECACYIDFIKH